MGKEVFGKYKAYVRDINDPLQRGRIRVQCPEISGNGLTNWCETCTPVGYDGGGDIAVPKVGETVYIEFEGGDIRKPLYVGNFFSNFKSPLINHDYDVATRIISWDNVTMSMKEGVLDITAATEVKITVAGVIVDITSSQVSINGKVVATGDVVGGGISLDSHVHGGVQSGGSNTSGPH